jgi:hypothetical protein
MKTKYTRNIHFLTIFSIVACLILEILLLGTYIFAIILLCVIVALEFVNYYVAQSIPVPKLKLGNRYRLLYLPSGKIDCRSAVLSYSEWDYRPFFYSNPILVHPVFLFENLTWDKRPTESDIGKSYTVKKNGKGHPCLFEGF